MYLLTQPVAAQAMGQFTTNDFHPLKLSALFTHIDENVFKCIHFNSRPITPSIRAFHNFPLLQSCFTENLLQAHKGSIDIVKIIIHIKTGRENKKA